MVFPTNSLNFSILFFQFKITNSQIKILVEKFKLRANLTELIFIPSLETASKPKKANPLF